MTERFERLTAAYEAARAQSDPDARERALLAACGSDAEMLAEVRAMLASDPAADFLEPPDLNGGETRPPLRLGEFELVREIASGSSAVVWLARQPSLDRHVALKVMTAGPGTPRGLIERFHREPIATASLDHPHIVPVFAEGQDGPTHWFAMKFIEGHSLARELALQIDRKPNQPEPLLPAFRSGHWFAAVARLCADAADALQAAHEQGIVHRDIKPQNLLLDRRGEVMVADFGIARDEKLGSLTEPGVIAGTWHYMSPEQALIENVKVDHRTDIYSLGVVLYELLTLTRPFEGRTSQEVIDNIRRHPARNVRQLNARVPRDLETICMAAMERSPKARYASAAELCHDLRRFLNHEAIGRQPPSMRARLAQRLRHHRLLAATVVLLPLVAWLGFGVSGVMAAAQSRQQLEQQCQEVLGIDDFDAAPLARLANLRRDLLDREHSTPSITSASQRLLEYRDRLVTECGDALRNLPEEPTARERSDASLVAMSRMLRATVIYPDDPIVLAAIRTDPFVAMADVSLVDPAGQPLAASAWTQLIDPLTGMPGPRQQLGDLPIRETLLQPGYYRFVVRPPSGDERSFTRQIQAMSRVDLAFVYYPNPEPTAGMVPLPGGLLRLPDDAPPSGLVGNSVRVEPFWLDRCEVTVGEYAEFLAATGHAPPDLWNRIDLANDARRPVVGVTWSDARAYAEWRGKRLPTLAEWMIAGMGAGSTPRRLPWTQPGYFGNCDKPKDFEQTGTSQFEAYLRHAAVVDADPKSCTPEGVFELFGNVCEWTESPGVDLDQDRELISRPECRVVAGHAWFALAARADSNLVSTMLVPSGPTFAMFYCGFRCARSQP